MLVYISRLPPMTAESAQDGPYALVMAPLLVRIVPVLAELLVNVIGRVATEVQVCEDQAVRIDLGEAVGVQLTDERADIVVFEVGGQDISRERLGVSDDKGVPLRRPDDRLVCRQVGDDLEQLGQEGSHALTLQACLGAQHDIALHGRFERACESARSAGFRRSP